MAPRFITQPIRFLQIVTKPCDDDGFISTYLLGGGGQASVHSLSCVTQVS